MKLPKSDAVRAEIRQVAQLLAGGTALSLDQRALASNILLDVARIGLRGWVRKERKRTARKPPRTWSWKFAAAFIDACYERAVSQTASGGRRTKAKLSKNRTPDLVAAMGTSRDKLERARTRDGAYWRELLNSFTASHVPWQRLAEAMESILPADAQLRVRELFARATPDAPRSWGGRKTANR